MKESLWYRYTTEHAVEYVIVALFIWGLVDIALRLMSFPRQFMALRTEWLPPKVGREPISNATLLAEHLAAMPRRLRQTRVGERLTRALDYIIEEGAGQGFREHLHYLSEQDHEETHTHYVLTKFVAGVTPVLGFLGTVVHFGTALSGISFQEMSAKLPVIVGEMGSAFNTTTVALAASMTMMFSLFVCERMERGMVGSIDRLTERELLNRFENKDVSILPFLGIVQSANAEALQSIQGTLQGQVEVWSEALERIFQRFDDRQHQETQGWAAVLETLEQRHAEHDATREARLREMLTAIEGQQNQHMQRLLTTLERAATLGNSLGELTGTLQTLARGEGKLAETQGVLSENLRVLRETQQIDEALHGLTAAIHLMTTRHSPLKLHEPAA